MLGMKKTASWGAIQDSQRMRKMASWGAMLTSASRRRAAKAKALDEMSLQLTASQNQLSRRLNDGLGKSRGVLLVQTNGAYLNPMTLLELYWAVRRGTPIVCVRLQGAARAGCER